MNRKTILVLTRGRRLQRIFRELAVELARYHRVVVLARARYMDSFSALPGVEVRRYDTPDVPRFDLPDVEKDEVWTLSENELRSRARDIEREIGLPVYKAASNYLLYGRLVKSYNGWWNYIESEPEILRSYVGSYIKLSQLFDEIRPDTVFYETIDFTSTFVAFALAYHRGIFALDMRFSPLLEGQVSVGFGTYRRNIVLEHLYTHPDEIFPESYAQADTMLDRPREFILGTSFAKINRSYLSTNSPFNVGRLFRRLANRDGMVQGFRNRRWHYSAARNRVWLNRNLEKDIPEKPYILFYLSYLPEASTCAEAPRWVRQDSVIEQLAINAPSHLKIVVKEHPAMYGTRGRDFFEPMKDLPNVVLCHPTLDNYTLLSGAEAVVTGTGTVGLEGILLSKRVGVLGRPFYAAHKGVRKLDYPEDIFDALNDSSWKPHQMETETRDFFAAYIQSSHEFGHGKETEMLPQSGGDKWARALCATIQFISDRGLKPSDFDTGLSLKPALVLERNKSQC